MTKIIGILCVLLTSLLFAQVNVECVPELLVWPKLAIEPQYYNEKKIRAYGWAYLTDNADGLKLFIYEDREDFINDNNSKCLVVNGFSNWCEKIKLETHSQKLLHGHNIALTGEFVYQYHGETLILGGIKDIVSIEVLDIPLVFKGE